MILSIDIGTTNVKCGVFSSAALEPLFVYQVAHNNGYTLNHDQTLKRQQDVAEILAAVQEAVAKIPTALCGSIKDICFCGQMHGVCLFNNDSWSFDSNSQSFNLHSGSVHDVITWEDGRCDSVFLESLHAPKTSPVHSGFGCATLCWLSVNDEATLKKYQHSANIMDLFVCMLSHQSKPTTSIQLAHSWGFFNSSTYEWEVALLESNFSEVQSKLPKVVCPGTIVGKLVYPWLGIPTDANIYVALGDFQCSTFAVEKTISRNDLLRGPTIVFNFGTGCQLAVLSYSAQREELLDLKNAEIWPYFFNNDILVAASLNGGNIIAFLVHSIVVLLKSLKVSSPVSEETIWSDLKKAEFSNKCFQTCPTLYGERHSPSSSLSIADVTPHVAFDLNSILTSLCIGIVKNVISFFPDNFFDKACGRVICVGKAFQLKVLRDTVQYCFPDCSVQILEEVNSTAGAAFSCA